MTTPLPPPPPPPGWYPGPSGKPSQTYWDGQTWHTPEPTIPATPTPATEPAAQQPTDPHPAATQQPPEAPAPPPQPADRPPPQIGAPPPPWGQRPQRRKWPLIAAIVVGVVIVAAGAGITGYFLHKSSTPAQPVTPVAEAALVGLLLSPDQINPAMGVTGMTVVETAAEMADASADPSACLPMATPAEAVAYQGSRSGALRRQSLGEPGVTSTHVVLQAVVLFSSAHDAGEFFTASAQRWQACSNRQYSGGDNVVWNVGPVSNTNGTLSATQTGNVGNENGTCQRALTVANNVAIDVKACSLGPGFQFGAAANIARQISAKVPT